MELNDRKVVACSKWVYMESWIGDGDGARRAVE